MVDVQIASYDGDGMVSGVACGHGRRWQNSQVITECLIDGNDDGECLFVAFEHAPDPDGCGGDAKYTRVDGTTEKACTSSSSS